MICICKVCCGVILEKYVDLVVVFYDGLFSVFMEIEVIYEDGCKGKILVILEICDV